MPAEGRVATARPGGRRPGLPAWRRPVRPDGPLRVVHVVPDLGVGGAERHVVTLLPALDRARFEPAALCIGAEGALFSALPAAGVPARALGLRKRDALRALVALVREFRATRPDVVLTRGYNAEVLGRVAAVLARVPRSVVWVHNCGDVAPRGAVRRVADRVLDRATDAYFGVAEGQVPYLVEELGYPAAKVRVLRNGVDPARYPFDPGGGRDPVLAADLGIGPDDPVVGVVAVLRPEKDHATLLRAVRAVAEELPGVRLLVIGDGPLRGELEALAGELGIAGRVVFTGTRGDVLDLLRLVDVVALTSYTVECFPMALLEAMAVGRPAVATGVGGVAEVVADGETGHVVPPRDAAAVAERLLAVLRDRESARAMGRAARGRLERELSLDRSVRAAEHAIEDVAGRRAGAAP